MGRSLVGFVLILQQFFILIWVAYVRAPVHAAILFRRPHSRDKSRMCYCFFPADTDAFHGQGLVIVQCLHGIKVATCLVQSITSATKLIALSVLSPPVKWALCMRCRAVRNS